jgi:hypothetical protein
LTKRFAPTLVVGLLFSGVAMAAAAPQIVTFPPQVILSFDAHIAPQKLPKRQRAGASLRIDSKVSMEDGSHPPALKELQLELDRNFAIDPRGLAACHRHPLETDDTAGAEADCMTAIVGEGKAEIEIAQPEQAPVPVLSKVLAFNAGAFDGKAKLLVFAYLAEPVSASLVIPVEVSKERKGIFRLRAVAKVPKIAGGYGSITGFSLKLGHDFTYRGRPKSYLTARCPDRTLSTHMTDSFRDGSSLSGTVIRTCAPQAD